MGILRVTIHRFVSLYVFNAPANIFSFEQVNFTRLQRAVYYVPAIFIMVSAFNCAFKQATGITPLVYRKQS